MKSDSESRGPYWFPAKRYGWGWGLPAVWQGWVVLIGSVAASCVAALRWMPWQPERFVVAVLIIVGITAVICYLTGEPPAWRWGPRK